VEHLAHLILAHLCHFLVERLVIPVDLFHFLVEHLVILVDLFLTHLLAVLAEELEHLILAEELEHLILAEELEHLILAEELEHLILAVLTVTLADLFQTHLLAVLEVLAEELADLFIGHQLMIQNLDFITYHLLVTE
jgi:hypothetical protein